MGTPAPAAHRHFIIEVWHENREVFKAMVTDVLLFLTALAALFGVYRLLHGMELAGYPHDRVSRLESLHYWAFLAVDVLFVADLILKLFTFLFLRRKQ